MEQAVELMAGLSFCLIGASFLFRAQDWRDWFAHLKTHPRSASLIIGCFNILIGSFIVAFHSVWEGWAAVLTYLGVLGLLKGTIYVIFPNIMGGNIKFFLPRFTPFLREVGILYIIFGAFLIQNSCNISEFYESWDYVVRW